MRRLTIWITATLAVAAIVIALGMNALGIGGKSGDDGDHNAPTTAQTSAPSPSASTGDDGKSDDTSKTGGDTATHSDKPGENK